MPNRRIEGIYQTQRLRPQTGLFGSPTGTRVAFNKKCSFQLVISHLCVSGYYIYIYGTTIAVMNLVAKIDFVVVYPGSCYDAGFVLRRWYCWPKKPPKQSQQIAFCQPLWTHYNTSNLFNNHHLPRIPTISPSPLLSARPCEAAHVSAKLLVLLRSLGLPKLLGDDRGRGHLGILVIMMTRRIVVGSGMAWHPN